MARIDELASQAPSVLSEPRAERGAVCDALFEINKAAGAGDEVFANIEHLRREDCVAVVTGQQAGLFTGPLYTIYKALSAIRISARLNELGVRSVPVFWIASEDHDLEEVAHAESLDGNGDLYTVSVDASDAEIGSPVGQVHLTADISSVVGEFVDRLPSSGYASEIGKILDDSWRADNNFGLAFGKNLSALLSRYGLVILDPTHQKLKRLASPIYVAAIRSSGEIVEALRARSAELVENGYHAQVLVGEDHFPLFRTTDSGVRGGLRRSGDGQIISREDRLEFSEEELSDEAARTPERFSPGVMLRSVVQDHLLPTICYVGGSAEIAYFAQNAETYRSLGRRVTPIVHRQSFTLIEPRHARTMRKYSIEYEELFAGGDELMTRIAERCLAPGIAEVFASVEEGIGSELDRLNAELSKLDPTIAESLAKRRKKIEYHISNLRKKATRATVRQHEVAVRKVEVLLKALAPDGVLQERVLNVSAFYSQYGPQLFDWLISTSDIDESGHMLVYFS